MAISVVSTIATILGVLASVASSAAEPVIGLPGCQTTCGGVDVPYPFGIGAGCYYHKGFNLTCDITKGDPRLLLGDGATNLLRVSEISISDAIVRLIHAGDIKVDRDGHGVFLSGLAGDGPYTLSTEHNELIVTGCNVVATLRDTTSNLTVGSCSSSCPGEFVGMLPGSSSMICDTHGERIIPVLGDTTKRCSGMLCCQASLTAVHKVVDGKSVSRVPYDVQLTLFGQNMTEDEQMPRLRVFVAEAGWFDCIGGELLHMVPGAPSKDAMEVPVVLDWEVLGWRHGAVGKNSSKEDCPVDAARSSCRSKHSSCVAGYKGYLCKCKDGFDGSPYITDGCQDINECELRDEDAVCFGDCTNTYGSFECRCPRGTVGEPMSAACFKVVNAGLVVGLSLAFSASLILLFIGTILIRRKIRIHGAKRLRKKFFIQNRGQLLEQLVSHRSGIADRMIISLEEIQKATNNFDQTRKLGDGGHDIVYKGILSDLHVVAIKKSKIMIQKEIDDFINEVAILSHINHRNIVKLYGCCLETEVPMLAFEFISNGTLSDHLHRESPRSIPWEHRLRIASEVGKAISYLHFSVSSPIIHRDIKSSNILLDDAFTTKVSDFGTSRYILISQTGITPTAIQGTIGYLDPMYYYTGRLSEKSDVYSFGVLLVELLTRNTPIKYSSSEGEGLLVKFVELLANGNLVEILDSQVVEEGGNEVQEVAVLAATCIRLSGDERPTMRQVEVALESIRANKQCVLHFGAERNDESYIATSYPPIGGSASLEELSRQYSQEKEFYLSARYPR